MSKPAFTASPEVTPDTAPWGLRTDPYVFAEFPAELVMITVGVTFMADVRGLVPDADATRFWNAFWADAGQAIEDTLRASFGTGVETGSADGLETIRETAQQMLAHRFAEVARTGRTGWPRSARVRNSAQEGLLP
jgi:uncharacterized protein (DUF849 family)